MVPATRARLALRLAPRLALRSALWLAWRLALGPLLRLALWQALRPPCGTPPRLALPPFDHVLGDAGLRDLKPELEQFAVNAWRAPKRILHAHPPDQYVQLRFDLRSPSLWARLPTPVAAKAGPLPPHERLGPDDCENLQD